MSLKKLVEEITKPVIDEMGIVASYGTIKGGSKLSKIKKMKKKGHTSVPYGSGYKKVKEVQAKKGTSCAKKTNTETNAEYRQRCGPRPLGMIGKVHEEPRKPRKKGQPAGSKKHSDLYTDENPKGTIDGLKFATVKDAQKSVSKIRGSGKTHAHKIQAAIAMEQRAKAAGKKSAAGVYRKFINQMKKKTKKRNEITESKHIKKTIGVFGGRFQPFHSGHLATYKWLSKQVDEAYITTSNIKKPPRHPMNFKEKVRHMVR